MLIDSRDKAEYVFNGKVSMTSFRITKKLTTANSFVPEMIGEIEPTRTGCLIFIKYKMLPSSIFLLAFTSLLFLCVFAFLFFVRQDYALAIIAFVSVIFSYFVALSNFHKLVKSSHKAFIELLK